MVFNIKSITLDEIEEIAKEVMNMAYKLKYIDEKSSEYVNLSAIVKSLQEYYFDLESCVYIARDELGNFAGILMAYLWKPFITSNYYKRAQDCLIQPCFTLSKKNKSKVFLMLLSKFEEWATENCAKEIFIGINVRNDIRKSMERKGYKMADYLLKKEVNYG